MASARRPRARKAGRAQSRVSEESPIYGSLLYVETSVLLSAILESDAAAASALEVSGRRVTSALTFAEAHRAIVRARVTGRMDADDETLGKRQLETMARRCEIVPITEDILTRAGRPFPVEPVRTLDAIHLATLEVLRFGPHAVRVATRDARIEANALATGYRVVPRRTS